MQEIESILSPVELTVEDIDLKARKFKKNNIILSDVNEKDRTSNNTYEHIFF